MSKIKVKEVKEELDVSTNVAKELLELAGGDKELVYWASRNSDRLSECKAKLINERINRVERCIDQICYD